MSLFFAASSLVCFFLIEKSFSVPFHPGFLLVYLLRAMVESLLVRNTLSWLSWCVYPNTCREWQARTAAPPLTSQHREARRWTETGRCGVWGVGGLSYSAFLSFRKLYPALTVFIYNPFAYGKIRLVLPLGLILACVYFSYYCFKQRDAIRFEGPFPLSCFLPCLF